MFNLKNKTRIKELREQKGLSQRQLATLVKTSSSQISRYEAGQHMTEETVKKICKALETNADYFLGLTDKIKKTD